MTLRTTVRRLALMVALLVPALALGCESGGARRRDGGGTGPGADAGNGGASGENGALCIDGVDNDMDGLGDCADPECFGLADCVGVDSGFASIDGGFGECTGRIFDATNGVAPVDIVWVIDNSGSMNEEAALIQEQMNGFAAAITSSGISDYHVVVMTAEGWVTVPAPLGTDPSHFLFVNEDVQSNDPMVDALARYSAYEDFLRPDAILHFVFVTDDESSMTAADFRRMMEDELLRPFTANAIVSPPGSMHTMVFSMEGCSGTHGEAAANGDEYWALATTTSGLRTSICADDWSRLFGDLTEVVAVPVRLPCRFEIPPPPDGMSFNRDRVNVVFTPGPGVTPLTFPRASDDCASGTGWIYDDPDMPTQIILCPVECSRVESAAEGQVNVQLGCATVVI